jgi:formate-dependent nitrite reductase cytochrome c552 subunit
VRSPVAALLALLPAAASAQGYIGAETCKACHPAAYEAWSDGPHAHALDRLPEKSRKDPRCTSCHAPGVEQGAQGVTCETCHGPGRVYAQSYVMRDRELARAVGLADAGEKSCLACHTESTPSLRPFAYAERLPLIRHWGVEGAAPKLGAGAQGAPAVPRR